MGARISRSLALPVGVMLTVAACTSSGSTPTAPSAEVTAAAGTYSLVSIDGATLPTVTVTTPCTGFTDSGTLALTTPSSYNVGLKAHFICISGPGPVVTTDESGTWTVSGGNITFTPTPRSGPILTMSVAALSGSTLTLSFDAPSYGQGIPDRRVSSVWRKQ